MNCPYEERISITLQSSGLKIFGILHLPEVQGRLPCVLFFHGFGGNKTSRYKLAVRLSEALSREGIASFRFDFRGCGDSEGDFQDITIKSQLEDARLAASFLLEHERIDSERFALLGRSLGGSLACLLAAEHQNAKALALWSPVYSCKPWFQSQEHKYVEKDDFVRFMGYTLSQTCLEELQALSVERSLEQLESLPLLLVQGAKDELLGTKHYEQYQAKRKKSRALTDSLLLSQSSHEFDDFNEQELLLVKTTSWFKKQLTPYALS